ncbi:MAG: hypothetical protein SGJ27_10040 [Candidatus Melainabacteria bacterium]|nr:hypothetical protein [Candidatus Melainabacteria bacterium]
MQAVTSRESSSAVENNRGKSSVLPLVLVSLVVISTVLAYSPVLFDFFLGDDFVHLTWLKDAVKNPELIWRNFHSSWLDGTTTRFYRPLISVFMVTDYLGWGANGLGFHITNVLFHLTATVFLFFTARIFLNDARGGVGDDLDANSDEPANKVSQLLTAWLYPLSASLIFGLYPLHTEAVSWITGRVDAVVTAFYVAAFYFYLRWRKGGGAPWLIATMTAFALGLLSKEMALTLPPAFMLYEAILGPNALLKDRNSKLNASSLFKSLLNIVKPSAIFWLMVVVYFGVRRYALGTFVGGYDDSLFFIADVKHFLLSWLHGLRMFLIPLNKGLMDAHHIITRGWEISLALTSVLIAVNMFLEKRLFRLFLFNGIFLAFCFAPVYKIFSIADDLQGARLAHVATVALSLIFAMAFIVPQRKKNASGSLNSTSTNSTSTNSTSTNSTSTNFDDPNFDNTNLVQTNSTSTTPGGNSKPTDSIRTNAPVSKILNSAPLRATVCAIFATTCFAALWTNNQAWSRAGHESNAIRAGLSKLYKEIDGDPQVLLLGLPDNFDGAYVSRNALHGMTKTPQLERDIFNCLNLDKYEQITPFAYFKESLFEAGNKVRIYFWDSDRQNFTPLVLDRDQSAKTAWTKNELKDLVSIKSGTSTWNPDGSLVIQGDNSKNGRPELTLNFGKRSTFDLDFVAVSVRNLDTTGGSASSLTSEGADLLYTNDIRPEVSLPNRTHAEIDPKAQSQTLILPLRGLPEWALGGKSHELILKLPHNTNLAIDSIELVKAQQLIPKITFKNSGFLGTKGYLHLSTKDHNTEMLSVDSSKIPNAAGTLLEITRPNLQFEAQNSKSESKVALKDSPKGTVSGEIQLTTDMFKGTGMYELRPWAVDKDGQKLGVAGDHIVVTVAP